jgi:dethiobiotin synthetase
LERLIAPVSPQRQPRILFVTGTGTGVGKTVLTGLLLAHSRQQGCRSLALKPFCSGDRDDATLLHALQDGALSIDEVNPWFFPQPLSPLVAARQCRRQIRLDDVLERIRQIALRPAHRSSRLVLIEGAGGLLAPLGEDFCATDIIQRLQCETIVVARNQLGTINHTLLTAQALCRLGNGKVYSSFKVVLMSTRCPDLSSCSNPAILGQRLAPRPVWEMPYLGSSCRRAAALRELAKRHRKLLAKILE